MIIRTALVSDADAIDAMFREFLVELRAIGDATDYRFGAEQYRRDGFGPDPAFRVLIAEDDAGAAGYLLFARTYEGDYKRGFYMVDLFVRARVRGQGVARMLIDTVSDIGRREGVARLSWSVHKGNARARRFYEKIGAGVVTDADLMHLEL